MTQEQKEQVAKHFDELHSIAIGLAPNIPDDISEAMKKAYMAGADYAIDMFAQHWISVKDRKPKLKHSEDNVKYSDTVIVTNGKYRTSARWLYNTWAGWYGWYDGSDEELKGITHWMPMPEPPKERGEE